MCAILRDEHVQYDQSVRTKIFFGYGAMLRAEITAKCSAKKCKHKCFAQQITAHLY